MLLQTGSVEQPDGSGSYVNKSGFRIQWVKRKCQGEITEIDLFGSNLWRLFSLQEQTMMASFAAASRGKIKGHSAPS